MLKSIIATILGFVCVVSVGLFALPALAQATTLQAADVLGQTSGSSTSFTSNATNNGTATNAGGFHYPFGLALDLVHHRLFVSDCSNNRVLEYNLDASNHLITHTADHVLGQQDFVSKQTNQGGSPSAMTLSCTEGLAYDSINDRLFVSDPGNQRVLIFDLSGGITDDMPASNVLGQPDFVANQANQGGSASSTTMESPNGLAYDAADSRLFATDGNNRVLIFDLSGGITDDMPASNVLGEPDFFSTFDSSNPNIPMNFPYAVAYDSTHSRLFIDDDNNSRVLVFDLSHGITDGMPVTNVLGQPDLNANDSGIASTTVGAPEELAYNSNNDRLFVGDDNNNRLLLFDLSGGITDGMPASAVIGTPDFTSSGACGVSQTEICDPEIGMDFDTSNNRLWMTDNSNNRVLAWDLVNITSSSLADGATGTSYSQTVPTSQSQGTLSFEVTSGSLPAGLSLNASTGVISGTPTTAGTSNFTIKATDDLSAPQTFTDSASLSITIAAGKSAHHTSSGSVASAPSPAPAAPAVPVPTPLLPSLVPTLTPVVIQHLTSLYSVLIPLLEKLLALLRAR